MRTTRRSEAKHPLRSLRRAMRKDVRSSFPKQLLLPGSFYFFQCYAVFCNGSFPRHHDMVELAIGDISAGRPAERFTAHSGSNHLDGNIRRALERRTAAQSNDIGATFVTFVWISAHWSLVKASVPIMPANDLPSTFAVEA